MGTLSDAMAVLSEALRSRKARLLVVDSDPGSHTDLLLRNWDSPPFHPTRDISRLSDDLRSFRPDIALIFKTEGVDPVTTAPLFQQSGLTWVHAAGTGIDHIADWAGTGIVVSNAAGVLSPNNAEYAMTAILAANINFPLYQRQQGAEIWRGHPRRGLSQQTLVILGVGEIGLRVARLAKAFGMHVIGVSRTRKNDPALDESLTNDQLISAIGRADFLVVCVPLTADTRGLIDDAMLRRMKSSSVLVNLARGHIVDEIALADALENGRLRAAVLDVFDAEPLPAGHPLWRVRNLSITPHISGLIEDWRERHVKEFLSNAQRVREGGMPRSVVDADARY
ncbi:MAG: D-2-hydroxyacid dehydrogenase [Pseudorhodoplanes sp.]